MIRLQGGNFVNQGRVEVYCNGQWGTICDNGFQFQLMLIQFASNWDTVDIHNMIT